jgi:hypothetical protein
MPGMDSSFTVGPIPNWRAANVDDADLQYMTDWSKELEKMRQEQLPDGTEWTPGYDDYDAIVAQLSGKSKLYLNSLFKPRIDKFLKFVIWTILNVGHLKLPKKRLFSWSYPFGRKKALLNCVEWAPERFEI